MIKLLNCHVNGQIKIGAELNNQVVDLTETLKMIGMNPIPTTMQEVIELGEDKLLKMLEKIECNSNQKVIIEDEMYTYAPCVDHPGKIICVGLNYRKHAIESNLPIPEEPILFSKFNNSLIGHQQTITIPKNTENLDYEAELGVVIGKQAKDVTEEDASDYIFGYFISNDVSARDLQFRSTQWLLGKTSDGFLPIGPYLVTKSEIDNPADLQITCTLNGEVRQVSHTSDMIFSCAEIVSYISKYMTLKPGDIIITGTPEGVIMGYPEDEQVWIQSGDEVIISIEKLGSLTNKFK